MPLRHVADQFRTKWRRSSKMDLTSQPGSVTSARSSTSRLTTMGTTTPSIKMDGSKATTTMSREDASSNDRSGQKPASKKALTTSASSQNPNTTLQGIGEYVFLDVLGKGKFSEVMLAQHYLTEEKFAIKIIDKRAHDYRILSRLVREITLMEALDHDNIVRLYETIETADSLFLIMEYVPGINLDEHLQQRPNRALDEHDARMVFRQLVAAVDYCHSRWVVHRDLKAPNVLIMADGQVKLADFGLGNRFGLQRLKTICGSMLYYSPEIITGQKYVGPEIDCWCLGILLFRMTTGYEAFGHARTVGELKKDVVSGRFPIPSDLSEDLKNTIRKCLTLDRRKRLGVRHALEGDPWLTDHGRLSDPFRNDSTTSEEDVRLRTDRERARRKFLQDMEEEKRNGYQIRRTVIYHPINASIYFTSTQLHSASLEDSIHIQEILRAELFQEIRVILDQVKLRPVKNISLSDLKSPFHHIFRKFKLPDNKRLRKSSSSLNFAQLYKRVIKDQISYYTIECNVRAVSSTTAVSGCSSTSLSTFSLDRRVQTSIPPSAHRVQPSEQDEYELILLVRSACELLGITYKHDSKTQLQCLLTLRNYVEQDKQDHAKRKSTDPNFKSSQSRDNSDVQSATSTRTSYDRGRRQPYRRSQLSQDTCSAGGASSSGLSDNSWSSRWNRGVKRFSLPQLHFHPYSNLYQRQQNQGIWSNSIPISSSATPGSLAGQPGQQQQQNQHATHFPEAISFEDGTAVFTVDAFAVPVHNSKSEQLRIVALRFSHVKGSTKVFKLATGWINGVLASHINQSK